MSTQIYSSSTGWIKQAEEQVETYRSGLIKTTQVYVYPGIATSPPTVSGANVYPEPVLQFTEDGFTRSVVTLYSRKIIEEGIVDQGDGTSAGFGQYAPPNSFSSKILKTGEAIKDTVKTKQVKVDTPDGSGTMTVPYLFRETFSFLYLAQKVTWSLVVPSSSPYTPTIPSGGATIQVMQAPFSATPYGLAWIMTDYQATKYGNLSEIVYSYEAVGKLYQYINNTIAQDFSPPPPP